MNLTPDGTLTVAAHIGFWALSVIIPTLLLLAFEVANWRRLRRLERGLLPPIPHR